MFFDVSAIEPGQDFRKAIDANVARCSVLLAMIGALIVNRVPVSVTLVETILWGGRSRYTAS